MLQRSAGAADRVLLFESEDLFGWKFVCDLFGRDGKGLMIECPDLRDDMGLLMYSEQFYPAEGRKFLNVHSSLYRFGALDVCKGYRAESDGEIIDYGFDFYAPQTFTQTPVMIGWLDMWDRANPTKQFGFAGQLTVPRCLTRKGTKLLQRPVYDKKAVRSEENFTTLSDHLLIGAVKVQAKDLSDFSIHLRKAGKMKPCSSSETRNGSSTAPDRGRRFRAPKRMRILLRESGACRLSVRRKRKSRS